MSAERTVSHSGRVNVGTGERWASIVAGGALVANAARQRSPLGMVSAVGGALLVWRGATGHCPLYGQLGMSSASHARSAVMSYPAGVRVERAVTILASPDALYDFWRDFTNLPRFMEHVHSVTLLEDRRSHWVVAGPLGRNIEWDAEIISEEAGQRIAWRTSEEADVQHAGSVEFRALTYGRGTEVKVVLRYEPPGGKLGSLVAKLLGEEPSQQVASDLRRLKRLFETGEEITVEGQPSARSQGGAE